VDLASTVNKHLQLSEHAITSINPWIGSPIVTGGVKHRASKSADATMGPRPDYIPPTPVRPRRMTESPILNGGVKHVARGKSSLSKVAQGSSIKQSMKIDVIDEEQTTMTDQVSVTESESSSKGSSNHSQNPLLDFMGAACMGSAWFTNFFPCAIVTINDRDDCVVEKLSRESAMNAMYSRNNTSADGTLIAADDTLIAADDTLIAADDSPISDKEQSRVTEPKPDLNVVYIQLQQDMEHEMTQDKSAASVCNSDASVCNARSLVDDSSGDEASDEIDLSVIPDVSVDMTLISSAPKKKKKSIIKLFGWKKTES
jgi:hypothetical protein